MKTLTNLALLCGAFNLTINAQPVYNNVGYASYYHDLFVGRNTANGEKFSQKKMTCAHRSLPFGTKLKVTNLDNCKSIIVTVNDRGPYAKGRILDLSKVAASQLDFVKAGVAKVEIEVYDEEAEMQKAQTLEMLSSIDSMQRTLDVSIVADTCNDTMLIKAMSFTSESKMKEAIAGLKEKFGNRIMMEHIDKKDDHSYIVFIGMFYKREEAAHFLDTIESWYPDATVSMASDN